MAYFDYTQWVKNAMPVKADWFLVYVHGTGEFVIIIVDSNTENSYLVEMYSSGDPSNCIRQQIDKDYGEYLLNRRSNWHPQPFCAITIAKASEICNSIGYKSIDDLLFHHFFSQNLRLQPHIKILCLSYVNQKCFRSSYYM